MRHDLPRLALAILLLGLTALISPSCGAEAPSGEPECCQKASELIRQMDNCCVENLGKPTSEMTGCCTQGMLPENTDRPECCAQALQLRSEMAECCQKGMKSATTVCCKEGSGEQTETK